VFRVHQRMARTMHRADELAAPLASYLRCRGASSSASSGALSKSAPTQAQSASTTRDWRFSLIRSVGEECQTEQELEQLLQCKPNFKLYDGFEPSGRMHIAQGTFKAINVNKCTKAGGTFIFWVADWFALMNDKMGGDLEKIKTVGKYLIEVWKAGGMDMSKVKFLWSSDEISNHAAQYWSQALDIARRSSLNRITKCCQIMGRKEDSLTGAQILYPIMQCTDIFFLEADICQLGVDQRKVNMLAREYCGWASIKNRPIILSHHMLYGLKAGQAKMSKSDADSAIFMEDTPEDVERKITNAYCPTKPEAAAQRADDDEIHLSKDDLKNPCLDYLKFILFSREGFTLKVGDKCYTTFENAKDAFIAGDITEKQLKTKLIEEVNKLLEPVRQHFKNDPIAKELLAKITQWKKENLTAPSTLTRLKVVDGSAPVFAVFAPLPNEHVKLQSVLSVLRRLQKAPSDSQIILWLSDWSAFTLDRIGGKKDCIKAFYDLFLFGLRTLAPELMQKVRVCWQGDMILSGPSEYWISVINAGRRSSLESIRKSLPAAETLESASQVVSSLMHVGDVFALHGSGAVTLCCDRSHEGLHKLAKHHCETCGLEPPIIQCIEDANLRLLADGEGVEAEVNFLLTDKDLDVNKKVKKAFCEPGNISFCPPIAWVNALLPIIGEFLISRKPDNGGDVTYKSASDMEKDFASGALHPGDVKPALRTAVNALMAQVQSGLQGAAQKEAQKLLENFVKAQQKRK